METGEHPEYSDQDYLLGIGAASRYDAGPNARQAAAADSRAGIAQQIVSQVQQSITSQVVEETEAGESRIEERVDQVTRVQTALELKNAVIADQCTRDASVYVLSAVHRERAAERLRVRIERLEGRLRPMVERIEKSLNRDPLEAFARLREAGRLDRQLATRYQVLTGVTREVHIPPKWTARVEELEEAVGDRLRVTVLVRRQGEGASGSEGGLYTEFGDFLQELGWTVRTTPEPARRALAGGQGSRAEQLLQEEGIRYVLEVEIEAKTTDEVEIGDARLVIARAGGAWELRDLADGEVVFESSYNFPPETKAADNEDAERAQEKAVDLLLPLMKGDLQARLTPGAAG